MPKEKPMPPKRITRITESLPALDKKNGFVGILDGKPVLVDYGSGFEDEEMATGQIDEEALRALGATDEDVANAQYNLEDRIMDKILGDSVKAYIIEE
jgi:hypothetical protein